jgi:hypothetical protein
VPSCLHDLPNGFANVVSDLCVQVFAKAELDLAEGRSKTTADVLYETPTSQ